MKYTTTESIVKIQAFGYLLQIGKVVQETDDIEDILGEATEGQE